jgi:hypothetical protein
MKKIVRRSPFSQVVRSKPSARARATVFWTVIVRRAKVSVVAMALPRTPVLERRSKFSRPLKRMSLR